MSGNSAHVPNAQVMSKPYSRRTGTVTPDQLEDEARAAEGYDNLGTDYREGLEEGRNDARKGRNYAPSRHGEFRDADDGYNRRDGDREFYRRVYRRGFEVGYRESFDRNQRYRDYRR